MATNAAFAVAKATAQHLKGELDKAAARMRGFPKLANGLTPDDVKASPEWRAARAAYWAAHDAYRAFNAQFTRAFKRELRAERNARREAV